MPVLTASATRTLPTFAGRLLLRPYRPTSLLSPSSIRPIRFLSTTAPLRKALAHVNEPFEPSPPRKHDSGGAAANLDAIGLAAANAHELRSEEGQQVVKEGTRRGRTLKGLGLQGKRIVVTHAHTSIGLTLAATFLEGGASSIVLLRSHRPFSSSSSSPLSSATESASPPFPSFHAPEPAPSPSPAEQLRALAEQNGWDDAQVSEVEVELSPEGEGLAEAVRQCEEALGGKVDVLCCGPPKDEEDAAASLPLLTVFCHRMSSPPPTSPYDPPSSSRSVILLSTPYGPRVDLPQPQLLSHSPPPPQPKRKAGAAEMSRLAGVLGAEWAKRGVRVNAIAPGFVRTPEVAALLQHDPSLEDAWQNATPLGRIGAVDELKGAAVLFASDLSRYTTGTTLTIDGGFSLV
ncbi:hypothetical protein JCM10207_002435 [Rhodosporidiobolus poonsookiae]